MRAVCLSCSLGYPIGVNLKPQLFTEYAHEENFVCYCYLFSVSLSDADCLLCPSLGYYFFELSFIVLSHLLFYPCGISCFFTLDVDNIVTEDHGPWSSSLSIFGVFEILFHCFGFPFYQNTWKWVGFLCHLLVTYRLKILNFFFSLFF